MPRDDLSPGLEQLREELVDAAARDNETRRQTTPPLRWIRRLGIPAAIVGLGLGGAVAGSALFTGTGDPIRPDAGGLPSAGNPTDPGVVLSSATPDPDPSQPPWVVRVYAGPDGRDCVDIGRLSQGRFGQFVDGRFRRSSTLDGPCTDSTQEPFFVAGDQRADPPRTVFYGLARDRGPVTITVRGKSRTVTPGSLGAWVVVIDRVVNPTDVIAVTVVDGRRVERRLGS